MLQRVVNKNNGLVREGSTPAHFHVSTSNPLPMSASLAKTTARRLHFSKADLDHEFSIIAAGVLFTELELLLLEDTFVVSTI